MISTAWRFLGSQILMSLSLLFLITLTILRHFVTAAYRAFLFFDSLFFEKSHNSKQ
jgi:hypothetical protein